MPASRLRAAAILRRLAPLAVALTALGAAASPAHATFPGAPGMFAKNEAGAALPLVADDPTDDRPALSMGNGRNAVWSPTGKEIAMQSRESYNEDGMEIRVTKVGGGTRVVHRFDRAKEHAYLINGIDWAPDGKAIYFLVTHVEPDNFPYPQELWKADANGSRGSRVERWSGQGFSLSRPSVSPDGRRIIATRDAGTTHDAVRFSTAGGGVTKVAGSETTGRARGDWRPDGDGYLIAKSANSTATVDVYAGDGTKVDSKTGGAELAAARFTPDGSKIWFSGCVGEACGIVTRRIPDPLADLPKDEPVEQLVPDSAGMRGAVDWQPQQQPVIFVHGFAGSRIACGGNDLWIPTPTNATEDLDDMRLAPDGSSNAPGTCGARAAALLEEGFELLDIYGSAKKYVERIAPGRANVLVWDWRKDPREAFGDLNAMIDAELEKPAMKEQGVRKVAIMAHSMGGILTRTYIGDAARAKRIARAVTIGTPYLGAAKALFPIAYGVELPEGGELDAMLPDAAFRGLARTMTGMFFLLPSDAYGSWLTLTQHDGDKAMNASETQAYIGYLGANRAAVARARKAHNEQVTGFKRNGVDYRVVVSTGLATLQGVKIKPNGGENGADDVRVTYADGDGTVPTLSGTQNGTTARPPLGENVPITRVCDVPHMKQTGAADVLVPLEPFLQRGAVPKRSELPCPVAGSEIRFTKLVQPDALSVGQGSTSAAARRADGDEPKAQDPQDLAEVYELPGTTIAVTSDRRPVRLAAEGAETMVTVTPLGADGAAGTPKEYGPITGEVTVERSGGETVVLDDGVPVGGGEVVEPPAKPEPPVVEPPVVEPPIDPKPPVKPEPPVGPTGPTGPTTPTRAAALSIAGGGVKATRTGRLPLRLTCSAGSGSCKGTLKLGVRKGKRVTTVGSASYTLAAGTGKTISVALKGTARAALKRGRSVKLEVRSGAAVVKVTAKPAGRKRR